MNRRIFAFNEFLDEHALRPAASAYTRITPDFLEQGIGNMFDNLWEIPNFIHDIAQLKFPEAANDAGRFLVNTSVGLLGFFDVASNIGMRKREEDFGQVLGYWGVGPGPYLMLPFLGASTVRDAGGGVVDLFVDPLRQVNDPGRTVAAGVRVLDTRVGLMELEDFVTGDRYIFIRDSYLQRREHLIHDGDAPQDTFGDEDFDDWDW